MDFNFDIPQQSISLLSKQYHFELDSNVQSWFFESHDDLLAPTFSNQVTDENQKPQTEDKESQPVLVSKKRRLSGTAVRQTTKQPKSRKSNSTVSLEPIEEIGEGGGGERISKNRRSSRIKGKIHKAKVKDASNLSSSSTTTQSQDSVSEILKNHNKKFSKAVYEPPKHSVRVVRAWERSSGKKFYDLTPSEREDANEEMRRMQEEKK